MSEDAVWVCVAPLNDEIVSVAHTEREAVRTASEMAYEYLRVRDAVRDETGSPALIADYFGLSAVRVRIGEATYLKG